MCILYFASSIAIHLLSSEEIAKDTENCWIVSLFCGHVAAICIGVGIGVYGGFMHKDYEVGFDEDKVMFYWAFFVGVAGVLLALVSGILFFCAGCCGRNHTGYQMTRVV